MSRGSGTGSSQLERAPAICEQRIGQRLHRTWSASSCRSDSCRAATSQPAGAVPPFLAIAESTLRAGSLPGAPITNVLMLTPGPAALGTSSSISSFVHSA